MKKWIENYYHGSKNVKLHGRGHWKRLQPTAQSSPPERGQPTAQSNPPERKVVKVPLEIPKGRGNGHAK